MLSTARNQYLLKHIERTLERVCATQQAILSRGAFRPAVAELKFGMADDPDSLPPLLIRTTRGREIKLRGKIDRVDRAADGGEVTVIDYKMRSRKLDLASVIDGLSLQLLTYLLVLQASGETLFKRKVTPVAAFYSQLIRGLKSIDHPDDAIDVDDPLFHIEDVKPRGVFDVRHINKLDDTMGIGASDVVQCHIKQDGDIGRINSSDAAAADAFAELLRRVERRIARLGDQISDGVIRVHPYRMGDASPCARCDFQSVCRFDVALNGYRHVPSMKRQDVLAALLSEAQGAGDGEA
jgi:ATP-dependent helicase/nuclease subunit B